MKKTPTFILALALATVLGLAGIASAQGHNMGGHNMGAMNGNISSLTPEQQTAAQKAYYEHDAATAKLKQQLFAKQSELNAQLYGYTTDDKKVQALTEELGEINAKLLEAQVTLKRQLTKQGIQTMHGMGAGMGMMNGGMGMMNGGMGMMNGGMGMMNGGCGMMNGGMGMHHTM